MKHLKIFIVISLCLVIFTQAQVWKSFTPPALNVTKIIIDSLNQRAIFFGGGLGGNTWYDGVWEMSLIDTLHYSWVKMPVMEPIQKRGYHCFIYDPVKQRGIVFCGDTSPTPNNYPCYASDVHALNLQLGSESWEKLYTTGAPPMPRVCADGIYYPVRNSIIIFGGIDPNGWHFDDVWELKLDSLRWSQINITGEKPAKRQAFVVAYDKPNNRMIIFGGRGDYGTFYNDVWALNLSSGNENWTQLYPTGSIPTVRCSPAYGYDLKRRKLYIFGGWNYYNGFTFYNDVYVLDVPSMNWTKLYPSGDQPDPRRNSAGTYDYLNDNFIIFGGDSYGNLYSDTRVLFLGPIPTPSTSQWSPTTTYITPDILINPITTGSVRIRYILPKTDNIKVDIIDMNGRLIKTLYSDKTSVNTGWLVWDKRDNQNKEVSVGIYFCRLETEEMSLSKKFIVVK